MDRLNPNAIVEVRVDGLFGHINQTLSTSEDNQAAISRLAILYGENGTGKTMLLRLAFDLISSRVDRGHKSRLVATPFLLLELKLANGTILSATRQTAESGSFIFAVQPPGSDPICQLFEAGDEAIGVGKYEFRPELKRAIFACESTIVFLRDDRLIEIEPHTNAESPWDNLISGTSSDITFARLKRKITATEHDLIRFRDEPDQLGAALRNSLSRLDRWFGIQYGKRTSTGMASSHAIYEQVMRRITTSDERDSPPALEQLIDDLETLSNQSAVFETYGLSTLMDVQTIVDSAIQAKQQTLDVRHLLSPYVETVDARFSALQVVYDSIHTFITRTNQFIQPKRIAYRVGEGLRIFSANDQRLKPSELSSGERHLLLILATAALGGDETTIFIIDEPEISLNATWQRALASTLLDLSEHTANQLILASHSLSLITNHRNHVLRLQPVPVENG